VCGSQRQGPGPNPFGHFFKNSGILQNQIRFRAGIFNSSDFIFLNRLGQALIAFDTVVKIRDGFLQRRAIDIGQILQEIAERPAD
jgi:hypothetical protein